MHYIDMEFNQSMVRKEFFYVNEPLLQTSPESDLGVDSSIQDKHENILHFMPIVSTVVLSTCIGDHFNILQSISSLPLSCLMDYLFCTDKAGCTPTPTDCTCIKDVFCIMSFKTVAVVRKRLRWLWHLTARHGGVEVGRAMAELMCTGVLIMLHWHLSFILPPAHTHTLLTSPLTINACDDKISKCQQVFIYSFASWN